MVQGSSSLVSSSSRNVAGDKYSRKLIAKEPVSLVSLFGHNSVLECFLTSALPHIANRLSVFM